jgi:hypothetical protein
MRETSLYDMCACRDDLLGILLFLLPVLFSTQIGPEYTRVHEILVIYRRLLDEIANRSEQTSAPFIWRVSWLHVIPNAEKIGQAFALGLVSRTTLIEIGQKTLQAYETGSGDKDCHVRQGMEDIVPVA